MKFYLIQQGKDYTGENGNSYKLVIYDKDRLDGKSFSLSLYSFDVYGNTKQLTFNKNV